LYRIKLNHIADKYDYNELIKIFLPPDTYEVFTEDEVNENIKVSKAAGEISGGEEYQLIEINKAGSRDKNEIKRELYSRLEVLSGKRPPWGILTGVRPVKLTGEILKKTGSKEETLNLLRKAYLLNEEKAELLTDIYLYQQHVLKKSDDKSMGLYIGIPFCPTRCLYCSFTSNQKGPEEVRAYLKALLKEIEYCGRYAQKSHIWPESVYIGGGTPTTLTAEQLDILLRKVKECFDLSKVREFTVEAGRPDTITKEKLETLQKHGIERISINPQTMKDDTLKLIGRSHSVDDIVKAFKMASEYGSFIINADLIAGLPEESPEDFEQTVKAVIDMNPANITVHTLAVKKASRLIEACQDYHYKQAKTVEDMLKKGSYLLKKAGYRPYYLYRQKHMAGALENIGYCKGNTPGIYNIRIMDESQSILALGAGGISKKYYPCENRLERVPNVSNYEIYIERIDEMIERKRKNFFEEV